MQILDLFRINTRSLRSPANERALGHTTAVPATFGGHNSCAHCDRIALQAMRIRPSHAGRLARRRYGPPGRPVPRVRNRSQHRGTPSAQHRVATMVGPGSTVAAASIGATGCQRLAVRSPYTRTGLHPPHCRMSSPSRVCSQRLPLISKVLVETLPRGSVVVSNRPRMLLVLTVALPRASMVFVAE